MHWHALSVAIAMSYYFRLPHSSKDTKSLFSRGRFVTMCDDTLKRHASPPNCNFFDFKNILDSLLLEFYNNTKIPRKY